MVDIKPMPISEKYANLLATIKQDSFTASFIEARLGKPVREEYEAECRSVSRPLPARADDREKYEIDYANWIATGDVAFNFIRKRLGEAGLKEYIRADVEVIKRTNAGPALFFLKLIRSVAPGFAFKLAARQIAYKLQWLTDYSVPELSSNKVVMDIPHCKVLDYPGGELSCYIGCQKIYEIWLAEQFGLDMKTKRQGLACTLSVVPISSR